MTRTQGERIAVVETKLDAVIARLDSHDRATAALHSKMDTIITNQEEGRKDRITIREDIQRMKPDVQTVADIKKLGAWGKAAVALGAAILASLAAMKGWIVLNWNWFLGR